MLNSTKSSRNETLVLRLRLLLLLLHPRLQFVQSFHFLNEEDPC